MRRATTAAVVFMLAWLALLLIAGAVLTAAGIG